MSDKRVIVILIDGMRPDALTGCGSGWTQSLLDGAAYDLAARTVFPSVTLPCHMSLFHSVDPDRHGVTTNTYTPQVRPIDGLCERLNQAEKKCAFFYTWEELRDLSRPESLARALLINLHKVTESDKAITEAAVEYIRSDQPDFTFLYLGETDEVGHDHGWMGPEYMACVRTALDCVRQVREAFPESDIILLADHGGHARGHGSEMPEDMTIPIVLSGPSFEKGARLEGLSIKDIAPTVCDLLGATPAREWEGKAIPHR